VARPATRPRRLSARAPAPFAVAALTVVGFGGCGRLGYEVLAAAEAGDPPPDLGDAGLAGLDLSGPDPGDADAAADGGGGGADASAPEDAAPDGASADGGESDAGGPGDASVGDGATGDAGAPDPVRVTSARIEWTTPTTARVAWEASGDAAGFGRYEIDVTPRVVAMEETTRTFDPSALPELGLFLRPDSGERVLATTVFGLTPGTRYAVTVRAVDHLGAVTRADAGTAQTHDAPTSEVVLWDEGPDGGYSIPATLTVASGCGVAGGQCLRFVSTCPAREARCFENLRRQGIAADATAAEPSFDRAYLEIAIAYAGDRPSYWSQVRLWFAPGGAGDLFEYGGFVIPNGTSYARIEIPIRALANAMRWTSSADLGRSIHEWTIGGVFQAGAEVRVDRVRIRW
jgi:hypothetical protein